METTYIIGQFNLIFGSDVQYERQQKSRFAAFIHGHLGPTAQVVIVDQDCSNRAVFCPEIASLAYRFNAGFTGNFFENSNPKRHSLTLTLLFQLEQL